MSLVEDAFQLFLKRISLPESQLEAARRSNGALRRHVEQDSYFGPFIIDSFLNGSFARRTSLQPIKDVDVIVVVDKEWLKAQPSSAMESLRRVLAKRYDERRTQRRRRAVNVRLSDIWLDVLLAVAPEGSESPLQIPDRTASSWIATHPRLQLSLIRDLGKKTNGNYSRLVRLLKAWARSRVSQADRPASFVLECCVYHLLFRDPWSFAGALDESFSSLLDNLVKWDFGRAGNWLPWGAPIVSDPALPEVNVASSWDFNCADRFKERVESTLRRIDGAQRSRWEDTEVQHWQRVFGYPFPSSLAAERAAR